MAAEAHQLHLNARCGTATRAAVAAAASVLGAEFVRSLDQELLRLGAVTVLQRHGLMTPAPVARTLWRGGTAVTITHWLVQLTDGRFGLIAKRKGRWVVSTGSRDDMLATVPDALMKAAVMAVLGGDAPVLAAAKATVVLRAQPSEPPKELAVSGDGTRVFVLRARGLAVLDAATGETIEERIPLVGQGLTVAHDGRQVLLRVDELRVWDGTTVRRIAPYVHEAIFLGETVVSRTDDLITFHLAEARTVKGLKHQRLFAAGGRLYALADGAGLVLEKDGTVVRTLELQGDQHFVSEDGRIASWRKGDSARTVALSNGPTLTCEKGPISRVAFAGDDVLVVSNRGRRAATFWRDGTPRHAFDTRDLGVPTVELVPLATGGFFGFAPGKKGLALVADAQGTSLVSLTLGASAQGPGELAHAGTCLAFANTFARGVHELRHALLVLALGG